MFCQTFSDMVIKLWRVYAFAHETLSLLTSFYCMQTPLYSSVSNNRLGVAFEDHETATYSVVSYHLRNQGVCFNYLCLILAVGRLEVTHGVNDLAKCDNLYGTGGW